MSPGGRSRRGAHRRGLAPPPALLPPSPALAAPAAQAASIVAVVAVVAGVAVVAVVAVVVVVVAEGQGRPSSGQSGRLGHQWMRARSDQNLGAGKGRGTGE